MAKVSLTPEDFSAFRATYAMTLEQCAALFGVTERSYKSYEAGKSHPRGPTKVLITIAMRHDYVVAQLAQWAAVETPPILAIPPKEPGTGITLEAV